MFDINKLFYPHPYLLWWYTLVLDLYLFQNILLFIYFSSHGRGWIFPSFVSIALHGEIFFFQKDETDYWNIWTSSGLLITLLITVTSVDFLEIIICKKLIFIYWNLEDVLINLNWLFFLSRLSYLWKCTNICDLC